MRISAIFIVFAFMILYIPLSGCTSPENTAVSSTAPVEAETLEMYYFYDELCGSCNGTEEFDSMVQEQIAPIDDEYPYIIIRHNVYTDAGRSEFSEVCAGLGLDEAGISFPVFIAGGKVYQGLSVIEENLTEAYLVAGEDFFVYRNVYNPSVKKTGDQLFADYPVNPDAVTAAYFYRSVCEECKQTTPVIDSVPETVDADGKTLPVEIIRINTRSGNNNERISAMFEAYNVPDEDRMVPIVFLSSGYLAGYEEIAAHLHERLTESGTEPFTFG